jgi:CheY-like chemotaxis protein
VTAASAGVNAGATFTVRLPVGRMGPGRAAEAAAMPAGRMPEGRLAGARILVVDDDQDTRELLASALGAAGADVQAAASAEEALAAALDGHPDALVSDIAMPGQDGYRLLQELLATLGDRAPRVRVAVTAFGGASDRDRALAAGFHRHVAKPLDPVALVNLLEQMLSGAR